MPALEASTQSRRRSVVAYKLKITVSFARPEIWRRFIVPSDITLAKLHPVVGAVMGWSNSSWHHFEDDKGNCYTVPAKSGLQDSGKTRLADLLARIGDRLMYHYGFEEDWEHRVELEAIVETPRRLASAECLGGRGRCPPEDCGGPLGFSELLRGIARHGRSWPPHSFRGWIEGTFDRGAFECSTVAAALRRLGV